MEIRVKVYANLRDLVPEKPVLGEPILMEVEENSTILQLMGRINLSMDDVAIILINGTHHPPDHKLTEPVTVALFSPSGGG